MAQNTFLNKKPVFDKAYSENCKTLYEINHFTAYLFQAVRNQFAKKLDKAQLKHS